MKSKAAIVIRKEKNLIPIAGIYIANSGSCTISYCTLTMLKIQFKAPKTTKFMTKPERRATFPVPIAELNADSILIALELK